MPFLAIVLLLVVFAFAVYGGIALNPLLWLLLIVVVLILVAYPGGWRRW